MPKSLAALYTKPVPINAAKYRNRISLCDSNALHSDYHAFYKGLASEVAANDCLADVLSASVIMRNLSSLSAVYLVDQLNCHYSVYLITLFGYLILLHSTAGK